MISIKCCAEFVIFFSGKVGVPIYSRNKKEKRIPVSLAIFSVV
jgi:hypothetical protein